MRQSTPLTHSLSPHHHINLTLTSPSHRSILKELSNTKCGCGCFINHTRRPTHFINQTKRPTHFINHTKHSIQHTKHPIHHTLIAQYTKRNTLLLRPTRSLYLTGSPHLPDLRHIEPGSRASHAVHFVSFISGLRRLDIHTEPTEVTQCNTSSFKYAEVKLKLS